MGGPPRPLYTPIVSRVNKNFAKVFELKMWSLETNEEEKNKLCSTKCFHSIKAQIIPEKICVVKCVIFWFPVTLEIFWVKAFDVCTQIQVQADLDAFDAPELNDQRWGGLMDGLQQRKSW